MKLIFFLVANKDRLYDAFNSMDADEPVVQGTRPASDSVSSQLSVNCLVYCAGPQIIGLVQLQL